MRLELEASAKSLIVMPAVRQDEIDRLENAVRQLCGGGLAPGGANAVEAGAGSAIEADATPGVVVGVSKPDSHHRLK